jgi:hypothetical protein
MNTAQAPPRARDRNRSSLPGLGEISRARHIVATLGGRFSVELGVDVDRGAGALDPRAARAARHVALPADLHGLSSLAAAAHLDLQDLEDGLVLLALGHDMAHCPGGEECPLAEFDHGQFVHF